MGFITNIHKIPKGKLAENKAPTGVLLYVTATFFSG